MLWRGGWWRAVTGYYYCRRKNSNQLQIPSCLVSVTVANYKWTLCYSFTSFAAKRMDWSWRCRAGWRELWMGERSDKERKTKQDVWRWDCRSQEGEETKRERVKSLARSNLHGREGTYVFYPANIEHDMWFTKEMKGFWTWILLMLEMFSGRAWNCTATDLTPLTNAIMHNSVIAVMISKYTIWPCLRPPTIELNHNERLLNHTWISMKGPFLSMSK